MKVIHNKRRWLFAGVRDRGRICFRLAAYWMVCQLAMVASILAMSCLVEGAQHRTSMVERHFIIPVLAFSTLVFPLFVFDTLMLSNRFTGPMLNIRRKLEQLADNESCKKLSFCGGDLSKDLRNHFNQVREIVQSRPSNPGEQPATDILRSLDTPNQTRMDSRV